MAAKHETRRGDAVAHGGVVNEVRRSIPLRGQWNLIWNFAQRDLKAKFNGTLLGWAWSLVVPLASLGIYTLVFSVWMRMTPPPFGNGNDGIYVIFLFGGLTMWLFFANSVNSGIAGLSSSGGLLQKIYFPSYTPVIGAGVAVGIQSLIEFAIYVVVLIGFLNVGWTWLLLPVLLGLFAVFSWSLAAGIAILNVYARDLAHLVNVALQLLFYATPILYTVDIIPESWNGLPMKDIIMFSPIAEFITMFRNLSYSLTAGTLSDWAAILAWTAAAAVFATWVYRTKGGDVGERI